MDITLQISHVQSCNWVWKQCNTLLVNCNVLSPYWNEFLLLTSLQKFGTENFSLLKISLTNNITNFSCNFVDYVALKRFLVFRKVLFKNNMKLFICGLMRSKILKTSKKSDFFLKKLNVPTNILNLESPVLIFIWKHCIHHRLAATIRTLNLQRSHDIFILLHSESSSTNLIKLWKKPWWLWKNNSQHNKLPSTSCSFFHNLLTSITRSNCLSFYLQNSATSPSKSKTFAGHIPWTIFFWSWKITGWSH